MQEFFLLRFHEVITLNVAQETHYFIKTRLIHGYWKFIILNIDFENCFYRVKLSEIHVFWLGCTHEAEKKIMAGKKNKRYRSIILLSPYLSFEFDTNIILNINDENHKIYNFSTSFKLILILKPNDFVTILYYMNSYCVIL